MSRDIDKKIAEWLGMLNQPHCPTCGTPWEEMGDAEYHAVTLCKGQFVWDKIPYFTISDADAVTLLPILAQKGFWWDMHLTDANNQVQFNIHEYKNGGLGRCISIAMKPTISEAISAAMMQMIEA